MIESIEELRTNKPKAFFTKSALQEIDSIALKTYKWAARMDSIFKMPLNGEYIGIHIRRGENGKKCVSEIKELISERIEIIDPRKKTSDSAWIENPSILVPNQASEDVFDSSLVNHTILALKTILDAITHHVGAVFALNLAHHFYPEAPKNPNFLTEQEHKSFGQRYTELDKKDGFHINLAVKMFAWQSEMWDLLYQINKEYDEVTRSGDIHPSLTQTQLRKMRFYVPNSGKYVYKYIRPAVALGFLVDSRRNEPGRDVRLGPSTRAFFDYIHAPLAFHFMKRLQPVLNRSVSDKHPANQMQLAPFATTPATARSKLGAEAHFGSLAV